MAAIDVRLRLVRSKTLGVDPLVDSILSEESTPAKALYAKVLELQKSPFKKRYVEACLLTGESLTVISDLLEIPEDIISFYNDVIYDVHELDRLSKMELLENESSEDYTLKLWAITQGISFIGWRLGRVVSVSPVKGLDELYTMCTYKAKEALFSSNASEASREGAKWTKLSMDLARLLKLWVLDSDAAKKDIEIALKEINTEFDGIESLGLSIEAPIETAPIQALSSLD